MAQDYRCFFRIAVILPRTVVDLFVYFQVVTNFDPTRNNFSRIFVENVCLVWKYISIELFMTVPSLCLKWQMMPKMAQVA